MLQNFKFFLLYTACFTGLLVGTSAELDSNQPDFESSIKAKPQAALEYYYAVIMCLEHKKSDYCIKKYKLKGHLNPNLEEILIGENVEKRQEILREPYKRMQQKITINNKEELLNMFKDVLSKNMKFKSNNIKTSRF